VNYSDLEHPAPLRARWRLHCADAVWALHTVVVGFFIVGWTLPWRWALWATLIGAVFMRIHWWLNDDTCVLTQLERRLRGASAATPVPSRSESAPRTESAARADVDGTFIASLAYTVFGSPVSPPLIDWLTHGILWLGAGLALLRLSLV